MLKITSGVKYSVQNTVISKQSNHKVNAWSISLMYNRNINEHRIVPCEILDIDTLLSNTILCCLLIIHSVIQFKTTLRIRSNNFDLKQLYTTVKKFHYKGT